MDILFADILQKAVDIDIFWLCVYRRFMLCHIHELCIAITAYYEKVTTIILKRTGSTKSSGTQRWDYFMHPAQDWVVHEGL